MSDLEFQERIGDWRAVDALCRQLTKLKNGSNGVPGPMSEVGQKLTDATARVFASYEGEENLFLTHLCETMCTIDGIDGGEHLRFRKLYKDLGLSDFAPYRSEGSNRGRPKPYEAAVETARRLSDLNRLAAALDGVPTSAV